MLKKVTLVLLLLLLCACRPSVVENSNGDNFNILSLQSASLSLLCFKEDEHNIEITSDVNTLSEAFDKDEKDIIIAPVNIGVKKCLENDNYKLLAIFIQYTLFELANKVGRHFLFCIWKRNVLCLSSLKTF